MNRGLKGFAAGLLWVSATASAAGEPGGDGAAVARLRGARIEHPVSSVRALRDAGLIKQSYDYSCGSAALATLLTYGLGDATDESWVLQAVFRGISEEQQNLLMKKGLSLLDLQRAAVLRGHRAQGFRVAPDQLGKLARPVIVFIKPNGYEHFAVLKGVAGDRVYLADPSLGNIRMPLYRFIEIWALENGRGIVFAVEPGSAKWPESVALRPTPPPDIPLELLGARELYEVGKTYPLHLPAALRD